MTAKQKALRQQQIHNSIIGLATDPRFRDFIEMIEDQKEISMEDALNDRVISNERLTLAALGEVRCYKNIISTYDAIVEAAEAKQEALETVQ